MHIASCDTPASILAERVEVLLVDDHAVCRAESRRILGERTTIHVVAEAATADEGLAAIGRCRPHVAILDLDMPGGDGFELAHTIRDWHIPIRLILLTVHSSEFLAKKALASGFDGYVVKDAASTELIACVEAVSRGQSYVSAPFRLDDAPA